MNFLFSPSHDSFACVRCKAIVKNPIGGLCEKCNNDDIEKLQKIKNDRINDFKGVLDLVKSDRDLLLSWLLYIQSTNSPHVLNELLISLENIKTELNNHTKLI